MQQKDRAILRELAKQRVELAHSPAMDALRLEWRHKEHRPVVRSAVLWLL